MTDSNGKAKCAAIYCRVSTPLQAKEKPDAKAKEKPDDSGRQETSLDTQEEACRRHAAKLGYAVDEAHVYREVYTGTELYDRPQLSRLRQAVSRREVNAVIAYAIDRLSRDPVHLGVIVSDAEHAGVDVLFVTEPLDNSLEGQLIRFVRGYAAKVEHEKIKERSLRGRMARAKAGNYLPGNRVKYGYRWRDERKAGLEIEPVAAAVVRRIFSEALAGRTMRSISALLTAERVPTPSGQRDGWGRSTISHILSDETYTGRAVAFYRQSLTPKGSGKDVRRIRPREEQIELPGAAPAIIDRETFEDVQEQLRRNKAQAIRNAREPEAALLRAGYVYCGYCGQSMAVRKSGQKHVLLQYVCKNHNDGYWKCDGRATITVNVLDKAVWSKIRARLLRPETIATEVAAQIEDDAPPVDLERIEKALAELGRRQRTLIGHLASLDPASAQMVHEQLGQMSAQRKLLEDERTAALAQQHARSEARERLKGLEVWCRRVAVNLQGFTYQDKRLALEAFGVRAHVWRADRTPRWEITASVPLDADEDDATVPTSGQRSSAP